MLDSLGAGADAKVHFEFRVASPKPGGNPSQTDAPLISDSKVLAIEAKWTEPRDKTVAKRLSRAEANGGDPRITVNGWLKHLQPFSKRPLRLDEFSDVVYQVLHRAASACAVATTQARQPQLVYLHFHPSVRSDSATTDQYLADLESLHGLMEHPKEFAFTVVEMPLVPTAAFEAIKNLDKKSRATSAKVSDALCRGPLFTFGSPVIKRV